MTHSDLKTPDAIVKTVTLKADLGRVWRAISTADEFGQWFGMRFDAPAFTPNTKMTGRIMPTVVNDEVAAMQKPYEGTPFEMVIADIVPQSLFSFRWHPYAVDKSVDYSKEPMTLITFALKEVEGGVHLTVTESGFNTIPVERRAEAFAADSGGWEKQMELIEAWLAR